MNDLDTLFNNIVAGGIDLDDNLPTFGGDDIDEPGVWSWDADRLLVGTCASDLQIVPRSETR